MSIEQLFPLFFHYCDDYNSSSSYNFYGAMHFAHSIRLCLYISCEDAAAAAIRLVSFFLFLDRHSSVVVVVVCIVTLILLLFLPSRSIAANKQPIHY